jgi:hypothetical protein
MPYLLAFSRVYGVNFFEALCVAGYIDQDELAHWTPLSSVRKASELDLVTELQRRIVLRDAADADPAESAATSRFVHGAKAVTA